MWRGRLPLGGGGEPESVDAHPGEAEQRGGGNAVLILVVHADSAEQIELTHVESDCTTMGEVPPAEATVLFDGFDAIPKDLVAIAAVLEVERVVALSGSSSQLPQRIGDVLVAERAPTSDQPGQLVGVVPDLVVVGHERIRHGEAEVLDETAFAADGLDQAATLPEVHRWLDRCDHVGQVLALLAPKGAVKGEAADVQKFRTFHVDSLFSRWSGGFRYNKAIIQ